MMYAMLLDATEAQDTISKFLDFQSQILSGLPIPSTIYYRQFSPAGKKVLNDLPMDNCKALVQALLATSGGNSPSQHSVCFHDIQHNHFIATKPSQDMSSIKLETYPSSRSSASWLLDPVNKKISKIAIANPPNHNSVLAIHPACWPTTSQKWYKPSSN